MADARTDRGTEDDLTAGLRESPLRRFFDPPRTYAITRFFLLRLLGLVYFVAFFSAARQMPALVGHEGLLPADAFLDQVVSFSGSRLAAFRRVPTLLFWLGASDSMLTLLCALGAGLSLAVMLGVTNAIAQLVLWALYMSLSHVGQIFYGYGWELQLLETGFLAIFLCPVRSLGPFSGPPPPRVVIVLYRWLIVRIMLGAGLIKLRGDPCWRDLTCLVYHYETQPVPSPVSWLLHQLPRGAHMAGVLFNHLVELVAPLFAFGPRKPRLVAGALFLLFQGVLIVSGNLSFLNWLTIVPAIACFDDEALARLLPLRLRARALDATKKECARAHRMAASVLAAVVAIFSIQPVANLLSPRQVMNTSFDPLGIVNTYGAFGAVGKERYEVILEGTAAPALDEDTRWLEYELPCKPGDVRRRPCIISPYHYRLDWQMWFAAQSTVESEPWLVNLVHQLLRGKPGVKRLLARDPFPDSPPRFVRAQLYRYRFTRIGDGKDGFWEREFVGEYMRPVSADDPGVARYLEAYGIKP
jgi:hypothetical protein